jgi:hypothetical protein
MNVLFLLGLVLAVAAGVRSTWSPCGVSMLSVITPLQEQGRGNRFRTTAIWFVVGATIGGATLGGLIGALAAIGARVGISLTLALLITSLAALIGVISDGKLLGFQLPGHDRQVNERWLDQYRSWVYGSGFGWQIGVGLATYIMTSGLYLLILIGALGASFSSALIMGTVFGAVRGLAVFAAGHVTSRAALNELHRRFEKWRQPVRRLMIAVIGGVGIVAGLLSGTSWGIVAAILLAGATASAMGTERETSYALAS